MPNSQIGKVIKPDGTEETIRPVKGGKFSLEELQRAVGGYIERVSLRPGNGHATAYVNEEGKLNDLPRNDAATKIANIFPGDWISGNMILVTRE